MQFLSGIVLFGQLNVFNFGVDHFTSEFFNYYIVVNPRCSVGGQLLHSFGDFCPSVHPYGKGRLRESTHLSITRHQGRVVMLSPAQWYNSMQLWLPSVPCWSVVSAVTA